MCGFVVTSQGNEVDEMIDKQRFRGPDARGETIRFYTNMTFAHVLLDISGEAEVQPYITNKRNIMVFNGEMYDSNIPNDTKFLAEGYEKYGFKFIEFGNWHGSFVYLNYQTRTMDIVRDHFGAKPLWIKKEPFGISVSTSLVSFKNLKPKNPRKGWNYQTLFGHETPFKDVIKVEPGQIYTYDTLKNVLKKKENLWDGFTIKNNPLDKQEFKNKLVESIRKVANNKQKTGIFLSGGLDSTAALGVVKDMGLDLTAYICAYSDEEGNKYRQDIFTKESDLAIKTCKEWGVPYRVITLTKEDRDNYGRAWMQRNNLIWGDNNRRGPRYALAKAASKDGCKVILTGDSADEFFGGYQHHAKRYTKGYNDLVLKGAKINYPFIKQHIFREDKIGFNSSLFVDLMMTSEHNVLGADQTCGLFGMESRPVYLSQEFARYIYQTDGKVKMKNHKDYRSGTYKYLLREVMKEYLPQHIIDRKTKCGWSSPWDNNSSENKKINIQQWETWTKQ